MVAKGEEGDGEFVLENENVLDMDGMRSAQHIVVVLNATQLYTCP